MACIHLNSKSLIHNYNYLDEKFSKYKRKWGVVSKILCGNDTFLKELTKLNPQEIHDSRLSNLEKIQKIAPAIQRVYIKPPPLNSIQRLVACADVSFNTHIKTIRAINTEAKRQNKVHKIIIMIELGDLREGVMGENLITFYENVFKLKNIEVIGIGANLNCLNGILPTKDKLVQLILYKELINAKFNSNIRWVSAGSSITLPLVGKKQVPQACNHFRIGETLYFGNDILNGIDYKEMRQDVFKLDAQIIEIKEKPVVAIGAQGTNMLGEKPHFDMQKLGEESIRAIIDVGALDVNFNDITPLNKGVKILGSSSDMIVLDLGDNPKNIKLGDKVSFRPNYNGLLSLMNSNYIEKKVV